jgi:hypothetical protein
MEREFKVKKEDGSINEIKKNAQELQIPVCRKSKTSCPYKIGERES